MTNHESEPVWTSVGDVPMERIRTVLDGMFDGVWMVTPDGRTTYANEAMAQLLGLSRAALQLRSLNDFLDPSLWTQADEFLGRQRSAPGERIEFRFSRADGRELIGMLAGSPITTAEGAFVGTMLNFSDVTGKRAFEGQLAQNEKMLAIGEFAGGLAHDFNNLLTAIRGHAELAHSQADENSPIRADLDQIILSADRASGITRKLLAFTRGQVLEPVVLDPGQLVADLVPMLSTLLGDEIDVITHIVPMHKWVLIDPVQFEQVIVNLVVNARDAMPTGGTLTLTVADVDLPRSERPEEAAAAETGIRIVIADTGQGMDEATQARAFDPFFTTKPLGKGTGLGLATVFGIITQSGGRIQLDSAPGEGTRFTIDLAAVSPPTSAHPAASGTSTPVTGSGVVLLVEDEPAVREFARRALETAGYTVLSTSSGKEALRTSERWSEQIDVLLTDVVMGDMNGPDVCKAMRVKRPALGVIYMSGFARDILDRRDTTAYDAFVAKPFSADALARAVSRVMLAVRSEAKAPR
jgi:two-component system, cell cycle sensor histidine kinase and response regulator CckA